MSKSKRKYTKEFKQQAISLALKSTSIVDIAKELGIPPATLSTWIYALKEKGSLSKVDAASGKDMASLIEENRGCIKYLLLLKRRRDIKKAAACSRG